MDLKYFAGHILAQTEIGKNLSCLPARMNKLFKVSGSVTIEKLLKFKENQVSNLYSYDPATEMFKFEHKDIDYLAKANAKLDKVKVDFKAQFVEELTTEYGISYVGSIVIEYEDENFYIKVPGELSYDPASQGNDKMWVDGEQINKLIIFTCILVKASLLGANSKFLRRLYTVMKPIIIKYYQKKALFHWMYTQVKNACMKKRAPPSYAEYLSTVDSDSKNLQNYLKSYSQLKEGHIEEVLPPQEYFKAISEEPEFILKNKEKKDFEEINPKEKNDDIIPCFSPELDEDPTPSVQELVDDLRKMRIRYEKDMFAGLKMVQTLENLKNKNKNYETFTLDKSFQSQCPIV